jgi:hypothetical protein
VPLLRRAAPRLPRPTTIRECDELLADCRYELKAAVARLHTRDDVPNRADVKACEIMRDYLLDVRLEIGKTS